MSSNDFGQKRNDSSNKSFDLNAAIPRKNRSLPKIPKKSFKSSFSAIGTDATSLDKDRSSKTLLKIRNHNKRPLQKQSLDLELGNDGTICIKSENPLVISINTKNIPKQFLLPPRRRLSKVGGETITEVGTSALSPTLRSSGRSTKRKSYTEMKDTDSDFLEDSDDDDNNLHPTVHPKKKRLVKKASVKYSHSDSSLNIAGASSETVAPSSISNITPAIGMSDHQYIGISEDAESPPTGTLPSLWYSRENFIHVFVIEKIIGWKTRPKVVLEYKDDSVPRFNDTDARDISAKLINHFIPRSKKRMDISRICPHCCPVVLKAFVDKEKRNFEKVKKNETLVNINESKINYKLSSSSNTDDKAEIPKEEVLLIKWRGRSHLHCSWERPSDLERFDTTNNTAKGKIKRYYQSQHMALGQDWRRILEEGRMASSLGHAHPGSSLNNIDQDSSTNKNNPVEEEDYFQPDCIEVERILACDENEMDMMVLSHQRALNITAENDAENRRHQELLGEDVSHEDDTSFLDEEKPWDPEDNVRYVVKWKGMQLSDITWEYWLHIKHDSVDQAEDFWYRQKAPDPDMVKKNTKAHHPTMREYKKLIESPIFGISAKERPIAALEGSNNPTTSKGDEDEAAALRLRSYQLEGVNWLLWNWWNKRSCILADEMGLGKTIQSLCFLEQLRRLPATGVSGPFLVVAPLSLVNQWQSECATWAPDLNVILYHGSANARKFLLEQEFYFTEQFIPKTTALKLKRQHMTKFHILITTYEVIMKDLSTLSKIRWKALVVDEAHRLKNHQSRLFADLGTVPRDFCLLLTGTPLQNSTEELWSLLNFSDTQVFASKDDFTQKFGLLSDAKQVSELHSVLRPYLLRRVKEDVEKALPPKEETILEVTLTPIQKTYYKAIYEKNTSFLFKGSKPNNAPSLMNVMMELRKCCNHPFLIKGAEERIMVDAASKLQDADNMDPILRWRKILADQLVQSSGKMVILMKLLPKLQSGGHKILIFSQMVRVLDLLEELLRLNKYSYERLDGSTGASARHAAVDRFNRKSYQRFVMLLSTRAGGLGLNLTSADTVIIFDSDWNPQNDLQAMARAHRIGQTRAVRVYRLLTAKTYEMHMFHSASMKLGLDRAVLAHQRQNEQDQSRRKKTEREKESQAKEIDELLKKGAYDVFRDDDDTEAKKFMETDIDQLLERSSRKVTYGNTDSSLSKGLGSFSKASFVTSDADGKDIDLDDPDFWSKAIGLDVPEETSNDNILFEKRNRKQVQVFDPYASYVEEEEKKKEKEAQKIQQEKEEKKRIREEKKIKKEEEKEKKKKQREEAKAAKEKQKSGKTADKAMVKTNINSPSKAKVKDSDAERRALKDKKFRKEMMMKKSRRDEQKEIMRSMAKDDPIVDRIKQAWEPIHRDRIINALLHFGFGRFCKVRNEASLGNVPIQDIEVFLRSYIYQLGVQASISLVQSPNIGSKEFSKQISSIFYSADGKWVTSAMKSAMKLHELSQHHQSELRLPRTLIEPSFLSNLRTGVAFSSLYHIAFMDRFNSIVGNAVEDIISEFGKEELGKRGCYTGDVSTLDIDLKARHVTNEELSHAIGSSLNKSDAIHRLSSWKPAIWWDRDCDLALIIGTFYHGLSNYQAIFADETLPFLKKIEESQKGFDDGQMFEKFKCVAQSATALFGKALSEFRTMQKNDKERAMDSKELTSQSDLEGSTGIACDNLSECKVKLMQNRENATPPSCLISLVKLRNKIHKDIMAKNCEIEETCTSNKPSLPSSKCLDDRLSELVELIQTSSTKKDNNLNYWRRLDRDIGDDLDRFYGNYVVSEYLFESLGLNENKKIPLQGPFEKSSATSYYHDLESSNWACMTTPKECRGAGIPSVITRHGLAALVYVDDYTINQVLAIETATKMMSFNKSQVDIPNFEENSKGECDTSKESSAILTKDHLPTFSNKMSENNIMLSSHFLEKIPMVLRSDHELRNGLCAGLLCCGLPFSQEVGFQKSFQICDLLNVVSRLIKREISLSIEEVSIYLKEVLIPHCLRLCLFGKDYILSSSPNRGRSDTLSGKNEKKIDIITHISKEMSSKQASAILPDPMCEINEHSISSIEHATVLLRRTKLSQAIQYVMDDGSKSSMIKEELMQILKKSKLTKKKDEVPIWWCPWIHDFALLQYASKFGLLTIVMDQNEHHKTGTNDFFHRRDGTALDMSHVEIHIRKFLFEGLPTVDNDNDDDDDDDDNDNDDDFNYGLRSGGRRGKPFIPKYVTDRASHEEMECLVEKQLSCFPSTIVIEQRLNFIIGCLSRKMMSKLKVSENHDDKDDDKMSWAYFDLPLFEHDQWMAAINAKRG